jgi:hypothetical protein
MKRLVLLFLTAAALWAQKPLARQPITKTPASVALPQKPPVSRAVMKTQEELFNTRIQRLSVDDPFDLLGNTRGIYLERYGVVLSAEVGLTVVPGITPFHKEYTNEDRARVRQKKLQRVPVLKQAMADQLADTARALDMLPPDARIVLGVTLFNWSWEDISGLPRQIVMQAPRKVFYSTPRAQLLNAVEVQEY